MAVDQIIKGVDMKEENIERAQALGKEVAILRERVYSLNDEKGEVRIETYGNRNGYFAPGYLSEPAYAVVKLLLLQETKKRIAAIEAEIATL
jgi:hypothetical protein